MGTHLPPPPLPFPATKCDDLIVKLNQTEFKVATYKRGLATVEEQLVTYRKNEVLFSEEVIVLKREVACKYYEISVIKSEFEKVKQEKEGIEFKIEKFNSASKSLDKLLGSQITDKSKKVLGHLVVPPPYPLIYNAPRKLHLSYSGLDEFKEIEFQSYGTRDSKLESTIDCDKKSDDSKEKSDDSLVKEQVSEDESSFVESPLNVDKETVFPADKKIEFVKPKNHEKPVRKSVRYAEMYRSQSPRGNQRNWNRQKSNHLGSDFVMYNKACFIYGSFDHVQINCNHHQRKRMVSENNYNRVDYDYYAKTTHPSAQRNMVLRAVLLKTGLTPLNTPRPEPTVYSARSMSYFSKQAQSTISRNLIEVMLHLGKEHMVVEFLMCDKKNYVLFTDTECLVLSPNFKLPNESQILLKIPRKDNMYSFDMNNIVPKESLTCLVAKLVKENLVRGFPLKRFENDQTCVAYLKRKQHRAS
ncbi:hypothetical protein Tco_0294416, partial [Tanacetum coccineum]